MKTCEAHGLFLRLVVCDALPKRGEFFALGKLKQHLLKTHGSLPAAYGVLTGHLEAPEEAKHRQISF